MAIYMKIDGIKGKVTAKGHQGAIPLNSVNYDVSRTMNTQVGSVTNREGTKPALTDLEITKVSDDSTPLLFGEATVGKTKPQVTIEFVKTGSDLSPYMVLTLSDVIFSGYSLGHNIARDKDGKVAAQDSDPLEKVKLNFAKFEVKYTPHDEENKPGTPISAGYNLKTAEAA